MPERRPKRCSSANIGPRPTAELSATMTSEEVQRTRTSMRAARPAKTTLEAPTTMNRQRKRTSSRSSQHTWKRDAGYPPTTGSKPQQKTRKSTRARAPAQEMRAEDEQYRRGHPRSRSPPPRKENDMPPAAVPTVRDTLGKASPTAPRPMQAASTTPTRPEHQRATKVPQDKQPASNAPAEARNCQYDFE